MNEKTKVTKYGQGIASLMATILLFGTLLPMLGNTARASGIENPENSSEDTSNPEPTYGDWTTVYGTVKYEDKTASGESYKILPDGTFITGPKNHTYLPLRFAKVEIYQNLWPYSEYDYLEGTTSTDMNGFFTLSFIPSVSNGEYYALVLAETTSSNIKNQYGLTHANKSDIKSASPGDCVEITFSGVDYIDHPAWNILDSVTETAEWVKARSGGWTRSRIDVKYPVSRGTSHWNKDIWGNEWIDIISSDGWLDYQVYHEYGHAIMYGLYGDMPAGDQDWSHHMDFESSNKFALKEGWAELFENSIRPGSDGNWRYVYDPSCSNDNLEYAHSKPGCYKQAFIGEAFGDDTNGNGIIEYDIVEGNMAAILWDIFDGPSTYDYYYPIDSGQEPKVQNPEPYDDDGLSLGFEPIWTVMAAKTPYSIPGFWDGWFQYSGYASTYHDMHWIKSIFYNHGCERTAGNYMLPETAPIVTDFQLVSSNPHKGWIDYKLKLLDEDVDFLRVRLERLKNGAWEKFHEVNANLMLSEGGYYTYSVLATALGDGATSDGASTRHAYSADGVYVVRLTVTDDDGLAATAERETSVATSTSTQRRCASSS